MQTEHTLRRRPLRCEAHLQQLHQLLLLPGLPQFVSSVSHLVLKSPPAAAKLSQLPPDALAVVVLLSHHPLPQLDRYTT